MLDLLAARRATCVPTLARDDGGVDVADDDGDDAAAPLSLQQLLAMDVADGVWMFACLSLTSFSPSVSLTFSFLFSDQQAPASLNPNACCVWLSRSRHRRARRPCPILAAWTLCRMRTQR